jgi:hypothetical protein
MKTGVAFIDTNVLVYAAAGGAPLFDRARAALAQAAADGLVTIRRIPLGDDPAADMGKTAHPHTGCQRYCGVCAAIYGSRGWAPSVWEQLIMLSRRYSFAGRQVHDANIVVTMLAHGERRLLNPQRRGFSALRPPHRPIGTLNGVSCP